MTPEEIEQFKRGVVMAEKLKKASGDPGHEQTAQPSTEMRLFVEKAVETQREKCGRGEHEKMPKAFLSRNEGSSEPSEIRYCRHCRCLFVPR